MEYVEKMALTRKEAAKAAGVSLPTLDKWLHTPDFPAFRDGRKWIIPKDPFKAWLESRITTDND